MIWGWFFIIDMFYIEIEFILILLFVVVLLLDMYFGNLNLNVESVRFFDLYVLNFSLIFNGLGLLFWCGIILKWKKIIKFKNIFINIVWFNIDLIWFYNFE